MNKAILNALTYLNELEVHGERNCVLLVSAIKELKPLQTISLPAPPRKIGARVEALLRSTRASPPATRIPPRVQVGEVIHVAPGRRTVTVAGAEVDLTKTEFDLLLALALRHPDILTRDELAEAVGRPDTSDRSLESHVSRVRTKLRRAGAPDLLTSVRGVGYRLRDV